MAIDASVGAHRGLSAAGPPMRVGSATGCPMASRVIRGFSQAGAIVVARGRRLVGFDQLERVQDSLNDWILVVGVRTPGSRNDYRTLAVRNPRPRRNP